jgi:hypothetical protein
VALRPETALQLVLVRDVAVVDDRDVCERARPERMGMEDVHPALRRHACVTDCVAGLERGEPVDAVEVGCRADVLHDLHRAADAHDVDMSVRVLDGVCERGELTWPDDLRAEVVPGRRDVLDAGELVDRIDGAVLGLDSRVEHVVTRARPSVDSDAGGIGTASVEGVEHPHLHLTDGPERIFIEETYKSAHCLSPCAGARILRRY